MSLPSPENSSGCTSKSKTKEEIIINVYFKSSNKQKSFHWWDVLSPWQHSTIILLGKYTHILWETGTEVFFFIFSSVYKKIKSGIFCEWVKQNKTKKSYMKRKNGSSKCVDGAVYEVTVYLLYIFRGLCCKTLHGNFILTVLFPRPFMLWISYTVISVHFTHKYKFQVNYCKN